MEGLLKNTEEINSDMKMSYNFKDLENMVWQKRFDDLMNIQSNSKPLKTGGPSTIFIPKIFLTNRTNRLDKKLEIIFDAMLGKISSRPDDMEYYIDITDFLHLEPKDINTAEELLEMAVNRSEEYEHLKLSFDKNDFIMPVFRRTPKLEEHHIVFTPSVIMKVFALSATVTPGYYIELGELWSIYNYVS